MKHGLGDCVCMIPAIKAIRSNYPDSYIAIIVNGNANKEIFTHCHVRIDKFYFFSLKNRTRIHTVKTLYKLWKEHFDCGILATMTPEKKGKILFNLLGISHCYGEQYLGLKFLDLDNNKHFVDRNLEIVRPLCKRILEFQPQLFADKENIIYIKHFFSSNRPKIAVNIGGADKNYYKGNYIFTRSWNSNSMVQLVMKLSALNYDICLLGGELEKILLEKYDQVLKKKNVINFVDEISVSECIAVLAQCCLVIGVDTGMQHVADALGIPTLSIFGPTNPKTHGAYSDKASFVEIETNCKYCFGSNKYYTCNNRKCLNSISVDAVYHNIKRKLCL